MWRLASGVQQGDTHAGAGEPCQDVAWAGVVRGQGGEWLVVAMADGAGTAPRSATGARSAVDRIRCSAERDVPRGEPGEHELRRWFAEAAGRVERAARSRACVPEDLACTLLVAIVGPTGAWFGQVGDGAIVARGPQSAYQAVFWPEEHDFVNETTFMTCKGWRDALRVAFRPAVGEVAVFTDGLQRLALDYATRAAHPRFFGPLFEALREPDGAVISSELSAFLASDAVRARTDDDRALVLATRLHPQA